MNILKNNENTTNNSNYLNGKPKKSEFQIIIEKMNLYKY